MNQPGIAMQESSPPKRYRHLWEGFLSGLFTLDPPTIADYEAIIKITRPSSKSRELRSVAFIHRSDLEALNSDWRVVAGDVVTVFGRLQREKESGQ